MKIVCPWTPAFNGNILPPLNRLAPISDSNEVPTCKHYPRWIRSAVRNSAGSNPKAEAPLWETVLALWRLGQAEPCEVDDGEDNLWARYVGAWLVSRARPSSGNAQCLSRCLQYRHRTLCRYFRISEYPVVVDFAVVQKMLGHLPSEFIPEWREPNSPPPSAPSVRRRPRAVPAKKSAASPPEDVDTQEAGAHDTPVTTDNYESAPESVVSIPRKTKKVQAKAAGSSSKRKHQESPNQPAPMPKRIKLTTAINPPVEKLDLSTYEFEEDSELDAVLIPRAVGVVRLTLHPSDSAADVILQSCDTCTPKTGDCFPTWHLNNKMVAVRCPRCTRNKRGCSFRNYDFNIGKPPTLRKTEAGDTRRAEQVAAKSKGGQKKKLVVADNLSILTTPTVTTTATAKGKGVTVSAPETGKSVSEGLPSPLVSFPQEDELVEVVPTIAPQDPGPSKAQNIPQQPYPHTGRCEQIFFEDVARFEDELSSSLHSRTRLGLARAELNSILLREKMQVDVLAAFTANRRTVMEELVERMEAKLNSLSGSS